MALMITPQLRITLPQTIAACFASLLQHGLLLPVDRPVAMLPLLLTLPGFTETYIEQAVQTIFVNGVAADRLDRILAAGDTLALSAAMPGLAGAIFRRQGIHGTLRSHPQEKPASEHSAAGYITLKLFNRIAADRVVDLLTQGIQVHGPAFRDFAARREDLWRAPVELRLNDRAVGVVEMLEIVAGLPVLGVRAVLLPEC